MADKYLSVVSGVKTEKEAAATSAGVGDAGKIVALNGSGKLDETMMPTGIGADIVVAEASEDLASGDLVNIYNDAGTAKCRKADASTLGKEANGFVKAVVTTGNNATIYTEGNNDQVTGLTPGRQYLSTTPGLASASAPAGSGNVVQVVGFASAAANLNFEPGDIVVLA